MLIFTIRHSAQGYSVATLDTSITCIGGFGYVASLNTALDMALSAYRGFTEVGNATYQDTLRRSLSRKAVGV